VLKRGVEQASLNYLVALAQKRGLRTIIGEYVPTKKNELVRDHYVRLGFTPGTDGKWILPVEQFSGLNHYITVEPKDE
jgi:predicted enzyme involved in methoxymalonyl-ACP biosynthesis